MAQPNQMWYYGGQAQGPAPKTNPVRQSIGQFVEDIGNAVPFLGEGYLSERIAGGPTRRTTVRASEYPTTPTPPTGPNASYQIPASGPTTQFASNPTNQPQRPSAPAPKSGNQVVNSGDYGDANPGMKTWDQILAETGGTGIYNDLRNAIPQGPSDQELNDIFNPAMNALSYNEQILRQNLPERIAESEGLYKTSASQLDVDRQRALQGLGSQEEGAMARKEDAISAARRLYNELMMGNRQRFGGASSASEAAQALQGREFQQQAGQTQEQYAQTVQQIQEQKSLVDSDYATRVQALDQQKRTAIADLQRQFNDALVQINSQRAALESEKAARRLDALQNLRNNIFAVESQIAQFQQQLAMQRQAAQFELAQQAQNLGAYTSAGQGALQGFQQSTTLNPTSQVGVGGGVRQAASNGYVGQIGNDDEYVGQIGTIPGSSDRDPRFQNYVPLR